MFKNLKDVSNSAQNIAQITDLVSAFARMAIIWKMGSVKLEKHVQHTALVMQQENVCAMPDTNFMETIVLVVKREKYGSPTNKGALYLVEFMRN